MNGNIKVLLSTLFAFAIAASVYLVYHHYANVDLPVLSKKIKLENGKTVYKEIPEAIGFDHHGNEFNTKQLKGKLQVANFFFTSCPVVCPDMTKKTNKVRKALLLYKDKINFVSFSIDPKRDSIQNLYKFAERFDIAETNWFFVNVGKKEVYQLARDDYDIAAIHGSENKNDFVHSELLTLVDENLLVRAYYDSTEPEDLEKLIKDIKKLLK